MNFIEDIELIKPAIGGTLAEALKMKHLAALTTALEEAARKTEAAVREARSAERRNKIMLEKAYKFLREGKALFAPNTTNSFVDEWLADYEALLGGSAERGGEE